jgi:hypothetical protein
MFSIVDRGAEHIIQNSHREDMAEMTQSNAYGSRLMIDDHFDCKKLEGRIFTVVFERPRSLRLRCYRCSWFSSGDLIFRCPMFPMTDDPRASQQLTPSRIA